MHIFGIIVEILKWMYGGNLIQERPKKDWIDLNSSYLFE